MLKRNEYVRRPATCIQFVARDWAKYVDVMPGTHEGMFVFSHDRCVWELRDGDWFVTEGGNTIVMPDVKFQHTFYVPSDFNTASSSPYWLR